MRNAIYRLAVAATILGWQPAALAQAGGALPIGEGVWADADVACGQAPSVFAYFGGRFGELTPYDGGVDGSLEPVTAPRLAEDGFLAIQGDDEDYVHIKPMPAGRAVIRTGGMGATGVDHSSDTVVRLCAVDSLQPSLRTALAPYAGRAAGAATAGAGGAADQPGPPVAPLGIAAGYYAEGQEPCGGNGTLFYYDGRSYAWIDLQQFHRGMMDPVGQPRQVRGAWLLDGSSMTVASPTRFTWRDVNEMMGDTEMRWCPASEVRSLARLR